MLVPSAESSAVGVLSLIIFFLMCQRLEGSQRFLGCGHSVLGGHTELAEEGLVVGRCTEVLDGDAATGVTDVRAPAEVDTGLDRHACLHGGRQNGLLVGVILLFEPLEARSGTTRALMPSAFSASRASMPIWTSDPVAMKITSG